MGLKRALFWGSNRFFLAIGRWWNAIKAHFAFNQYIKTNRVTSDISNVKRRALTWNTGDIQTFLSQFVTIKNAVKDGRLNTLDITMLEVKNSAVPGVLVDRCYLKLFELLNRHQTVKTVKFWLSGPSSHTMVRALAELLRRNHTIESLKLNRFGHHDSKTLTLKQAKLLELALQENQSINTLLVRKLTTDEGIGGIDENYKRVRSRVTQRMSSRNPQPEADVRTQPLQGFAYTKGVKQAQRGNNPNTAPPSRSTGFCATM